jgi:PAS domain S-box-containing protein
MNKYININLKNPNLFLFFAIVSSAIVLILGGIRAYNIQEDVLKNSEESQRIGTLVENIRFFDEVLTGSTLLAANTGNAQWEKLYRFYEPKLDSAINELYRMDPSHTINPTLKMTESANIQLETLEYHVFELVRLGKRNEAYEIITGSEYARQKAIHSEGLSTFINLHKVETDQLQTRLRKAATHSKWAFGLAILLLAIVWLTVERFLSKSRTKILKQNQELEVQIQARKESESALWESKKQIEKTQEHLKESIKASGVGLWDWNMQTNEVYQSPEWKKQIGYEDDELQSSFETYISHLHPSNIKNLEETTNEFISGKRDKSESEYRFRHKDGSYRWILAKASVQYDKNGKPWRLLGSNLDITERKNAEQLIRGLNERFSLIAQATNDCVYDWDILTNQIWWNPALSRLFNYPPEINTTDYLWREERIHPDDLDSMMQSVQNVFDTKMENWNGEYRFKCADGSYAYVFDRGIVLYDKDKNPIRWVGSIMDISKRKKTEEKIKMLASAVKNSGESIAITDKDYKIIYVNNFFCEMSGYKEEEIIGQSIYVINSQNNLPEVINDLFSTISKKKRWSGEILHKRKDGNDFMVQLSLAPLLNDKGELNSIVGILRDITERKRAEAEINKTNKALIKLNAEKDKFFSIIAHDLKTPFNSIIGFSEILVEQVKEKNYQGIEEYTGIILKSSQRAMDLLTNLMEWSRSQTGKMEFNPAYFQMTRLINEVELLLDNAAGQKSIVITNTVPDNIAVYADENMMSAVLRNLISNAIKFTHPGGKINISAEKKEELTVSVSDNGIGIPKNRIEQLFRIDENYSTSGTQNEKGTGLGLILCKEFIEKHGGKIWVESEEGKGSIFHFTLP